MRKKIKKKKRKKEKKKKRERERRWGMSSQCNRRYDSERESHVND